MQNLLALHAGSSRCVCSNQVAAAQLVHVVDERPEDVYLSAQLELGN
jgi:hypothetical protein